MKQIPKPLGSVIAGEGDTPDGASAKTPGAIEPTVILVIAGQSRQPAAALAKARKAKKDFEGATLAILSEPASAEEVAAALRVGADALLPRLSRHMLGHSLQLVMPGHTLFPALPDYELPDHELGAERMVAAAPASAATPSPPRPAEPPRLAVVAPVAASQVILPEDPVPLPGRIALLRRAWLGTTPGLRWRAPYARRSRPTGGGRSCAAFPRAARTRPSHANSQSRRRG